MNEIVNEKRDTQFAGFARLVVDELYDAMGDWVDIDNTNWRKDFEKIIARRAYDLASHVCEHNASVARSAMNGVPDLTVWIQDTWG